MVKGLFLNISELKDVFDIISFVDLEGHFKLSEEEITVMVKIRDYLSKEEENEKNSSRN